MANKERLITVIVSDEIYNKLQSRKKVYGVTIQHQVVECLKSLLGKKSVAELT